MPHIQKTIERDPKKKGIYAIRFILQKSYQGDFVFVFGAYFVIFCRHRIVLVI